MGANSRIEWCEHTWNPWIGCTAVSPACDHCYAERTAMRFGVAWGPHAERRRTAASTWAQPMRWNRLAAAAGRRDRVFSASLADFFDNAVPIDWLAEALDVVRQTPNLIWLILTKRPQLIRSRLHQAATAADALDRPKLVEWIGRWMLQGDPPENVWLGTTAENQTEHDRRVPHLRAVPAVRRFLSSEPLLGPLVADLDGIDWIIAGGESGRQARAAHPDWFRSLRDQCAAADVPFFFKQWGEWAPCDADDETAPFPNGWRALAGHPHVARAEELTPSAGAAFVAWFGKKGAGATLDGAEHRAVPL